MVGRLGIIGLETRLHPVEVADHDADACSIELGIAPIVGKMSPVFGGRSGAGVSCICKFALVGHGGGLQLLGGGRQISWRQCRRLNGMV